MAYFRRCGARRAVVGRLEMQFGNDSKVARAPRTAMILVLTIVMLLGLATSGAHATTVTPTPKQVTVTSSGKNQNSSIDARGDMIVFTSNVADNADSTFDVGALGNDFTPAGATHPNPACTNCSNTDQNGELFLWRLKASKTGQPANSFQQLTNTASGGFAANQNPTINQKGTVVVWDSDRDQIAGQNADGNREIFLYNLATNAISQITNTSGGGDAANRNADVTDDGNIIVFDSNRDFSTAPNCFMPDGVTACDNTDGNSEIMMYNRKLDRFTQVTNTTGNGNSANIRPRVSSEGLFVSFQSTEDFSAVNCVMADGSTACNNADGNGEIMRFDVKNNKFIQITNTISCGGATANERAEISKKGAYITWQSTCEAQIDPTGCGTCDGNDEAFIFDAGKHRVLQMTITQGGSNRVPRVAGGGGYVVFESNRNLNNLNPTKKLVLYIIKRNTAPPTATTTGPGQLTDDAGSTLVQNAKVKVVTVNFAGGFNTSVEVFGISAGGKYISFDNGHGGVGRPNQEIWFLDRTK
jgi:Tol biopolymer transport system component